MCGLPDGRVLQTKVGEAAWYWNDEAGPLCRNGFAVAFAKYKRDNHPGEAASLRLASLVNELNGEEAVELPDGLWELQPLAVEPTEERKRRIQTLVCSIVAPKPSRGRRGRRR